MFRPLMLLVLLSACSNENVDPVIVMTGTLDPSTQTNTNTTPTGTPPGTTPTPTDTPPTGTGSTKTTPTTPTGTGTGTGPGTGTTVPITPPTTTTTTTTTTVPTTNTTVPTTTTPTTTTPTTNPWTTTTDSGTTDSGTESGDTGTFTTTTTTTTTTVPTTTIHTGYDCPNNDAAESNDSLATATSLVVGTEIYQVIEGDEDWFEITLAPGESIDVNVSWNASEDILDLYIDTNGDGLADLTSNNTGSADEDLSYVNATGSDQTIYVQIREWQVIDCEYYQLNVTLTASTCVDDALEENDTSGTAKPLTPGTASLQSLVNDDDWFTVVVGPGATLTATTDAQNSAILLTAYTNPTGSAVATATGTGTTRGLSYTNLSGSDVTLYLKAPGSTGDCQSYDLTISILASTCNNSTFEADNSAVNATTAGPGTYSAEVDIDDEDWYSVELAPGQTIDATASYAAATDSLDLYLYSDTSGTVGDSSIAGPGLSESVSYTNNTGANLTVYLKVKEFDAPGCDTYDLNIALSGDSCSLLEPNNTYNTATVVGEGSLVSGIEEGDKDWFIIEVPNATTVNVNTTWSSAVDAMDLFLYTTPADLFSYEDLSNNLSNDPENVSYTNNTGATQSVYILAQEYDATTCESYTLTVSFAVCENTDYETDDDSADAHPIGAGVTAQVSNGDLDWFTAEVGPGEVIDLTATWASDNDSLDLYLFLDPAGSAIDVSYYGVSSDQVSYFNYTATTQTVYLLVAEYEAATCEDYTLTTTTHAPPACNSTAEVNETADTAVAVADGTQSFEVTDLDVDWFTVTVLPEETIDVTASFSGATDVLDLYLFVDPTALSVDASANGAGLPEAVTYTNTTGSAVTLYVYVRAFDTVSECEDYDLTISRSGGSCNVAYEPNESYSTAATIAIGLTDMQIETDDNDWFVFTLQAGDTLHATASWPTTDDPLDLYLYTDPTQASVVNSLNLAGVDEDLSYTNSTGSAQTVYLRAKAWQPNDCETYTLNTDIIPGTCTNSTLESNDTSATAAALPLGISLLELDDTDEDWFTINLSPGSTLNATVNWAAPNIDALDLYLYTDPAASSVVNSLFGHPEVISYENTTGSTQTLYLLVDEWDFDTCSTYGMTVSVTP